MVFRIGEDVMVLQVGPDKGKVGKISRRIIDVNVGVMGDSYDVDLEDAKEIRFMGIELIGVSIQTDNKYHTASIDIASLVIEKQKSYGDSFGKSGQIMKILYPDGIPLEKVDDALTIVRVIDKLFRIATKRDAFGESPWKDIMGYALLASVKDKEVKA